MSREIVHNIGFNQIEVHFGISVNRACHLSKKNKIILILIYMSETKGQVPNISFSLLVYETIKYINSKNILPRDKLIEIEEFGSRIGERIVNLLLNQTTGVKAKMETHDIIKFIGNQVWEFIFPKPISKISTNKNDVYIFEINEINLFIPVVRDKEPTTEDMVLADFLLNFLSGMIKGALQVFEVEALVNGSFKFDVLYKDLVEGKRDSAAFSFNLTLLS